MILYMEKNLILSGLINHNQLTYTLNTNRRMFDILLWIVTKQNL